MSVPLGSKKTHCPHCGKRFWLHPSDAEMPTAAQLAAAEILGSTTTPVDLLATLVAAWDAECDRTLELVKAQLPDLDVEPMRASLRGRYTQWRRASNTFMDGSDPPNKGLDGETGGGA